MSGKILYAVVFLHVNIEVNSGTLIVASGLKELVLYLNGSLSFFLAIGIINFPVNRGQFDFIWFDLGSIIAQQLSGVTLETFFESRKHGHRF